MIEEYKKNHGKDPSAALWYRLLDQAHAEVAVANEGKRSRKAQVRPDYVNVDKIA